MRVSLKQFVLEVVLLHILDVSWPRRCSSSIYAGVEVTDNTPRTGAKTATCGEVRPFVLLLSYLYHKWRTPSKIGYAISDALRSDDTF